MGHASSRAALIYLHSTQERQRVMADAVDERARRDLGAGSCGMNVAAKSAPTLTAISPSARETRLTCARGR